MKRTVATILLSVLFVQSVFAALDEIPAGSTTDTVQFYVVQSADHLSAFTGGSSFTVYYAVAGGTATAMTTPTVTEMDSTHMPGWYKLAVDESAMTTVPSGHDGVALNLHITHSNMDPLPCKVIVRGLLSASTVGTVTTLTGHTAQTGDAYARLGAPAGASVSADVAAVKSDSAAAKAAAEKIDTATELRTLLTGSDTAVATAAALDAVDNYVDTEVAAILADTGTDGVALADDAITASKFDESTAFPLKSADTGSTAVARTGADSDTLETLSDQLDGVVSGSLTEDEMIASMRENLMEAAIDNDPNTDSLFDIAARIGVLEAKLASMIESDGSTGWEYTAASLINAPTGTGGFTEADRDMLTNASNDANAIDTGAELRTLLAGSDTALATAAQATAIETDTQDLQTQIGTDGAGLTAIGDTRMANLDATVSSRLAPAGTLAAVTTVTNLTNLPAATSDWLTAAAVKADAVTKIQNGLATPTNITAGTITTVTNLTNAPTNGDLTATMKASVNAEVDTALNTAIPGSPTTDSINERIVAIDAYGAPPSAATIKTAMEADGSMLEHLHEMTEDDAGTRRYTTNALEQSPTGSGGFTSDDRTKLETIHGKLPSKNYLTGTANSDGDVQANEATGNFPGTVGKSAVTLATADVTGNLPADVKAYTTQPTITGATLDSAYDAAKTAAQAGNAMTLTAAYDAAKTAAQPGADGDTLKTLSDQIDALNDLSSVQAQAAAAAALAAYDVPTEAQMNARTLVAADYFDPAADTVTADVDVDESAIASAVAAGMLAEEIDGVPWETILEAQLADLCGRVTVSGSGSTRTYTYYKRDNTTVIMTITVTVPTGARSAAGTIGED